MNPLFTIDIVCIARFVFSLGQWCLQVVVLPYLQTKWVIYFSTNSVHFNRCTDKSWSLWQKTVSLVKPLWLLSTLLCYLVNYLCPSLTKRLFILKIYLIVSGNISLNSLGGYHLLPLWGAWKKWKHTPIILPISGPSSLFTPPPLPILIWRIYIDVMDITNISLSLNKNSISIRFK